MLGHNFVGGVCLNGCGITQKELSHPVRPISDDYWSGYLKKIAIRKPETKAKTYFNEVVDPYMPYIKWDTTDPLEFEEHIRKVYMAIRVYWNSHTNFETVSLLNWLKKKNCLHPMAVVSLFLNTKQKRYGR